MSKRDMIIMGLKACEKGACDLCPYMGEVGLCQAQLISDAMHELEGKNVLEQRYTETMISVATGYMPLTIHRFREESGIEYNPSGYTLDEVWKIVGGSRIINPACLEEFHGPAARELNLMLNMFTNGKNGGAAVNRYQSAG